MELGKNQIYSLISKSTHFLTRRNKKSYANYYVPDSVLTSRWERFYKNLHLEVTYVKFLQYRVLVFFCLKH
jgi:hypothetical protein